MASRGRIVATVEARTGSSRLPGKVLAEVCGAPMLEHILRRLARSRRLDAICVATTRDPADDAVAALAARVGVACYRGCTEDVLDRVVRAGRTCRADILVEITGDCAVIDPTVVDRVIEVYLQGGYDYVSNVMRLTYPPGIDAQVFSLALLEQVAALTRDPEDREHVTRYIYRRPERFRCLNVEAPAALTRPTLRLMVDYPEDLEFVRRVYGALYPRNPAFGLEEILDLVDRDPGLARINGHLPI